MSTSQTRPFRLSTYLARGLAACVCAPLVAWLLGGLAQSLGAATVASVLNGTATLLVVLAAFAAVALVVSGVRRQAALRATGVADEARVAAVTATCASDVTDAPRAPSPQGRPYHPDLGATQTAVAAALVSVGDASASGA